MVSFTYVFPPKHCITSSRLLTCYMSRPFHSYLRYIFPHGATAHSGPWPHYQGFMITLTDTHTLGRTPLDEWSARRRDLYLTTHNNHERKTSISPGGIRTHNPSKRVAAHPRLKPRGYRYQLQQKLTWLNLFKQTLQPKYPHWVIGTDILKGFNVSL